MNINVSNLNCPKYLPSVNKVSTVIEWHHKDVNGTNTDTISALSDKLVNIIIPGKTERSATDEVVTTEVRPRSRPEGRKLDGTLSLPPPPILEKK